MKTVYILLGQRGAGKSFIGNLMEQYFNILFIQVEPFFIEATQGGTVMNDEVFTKAWNNIGVEIDSILSDKDSVCFESMGIFDSYINFEERIRSKYNVVTILVETDANTAVDRVEKRDLEAHVPMDADSLKAVNTEIRDANIAAKADFILENQANKTTEQLAADLESIVI